MSVDRRILVRGALALALALVAGPARAVTQEVPIGPRPLAMGGAFTAIADDATGIFWNPAALVQMDKQELGLSHSNLYESGISSDRVAFVLPITRSQVAGLDWYRLGYDDTELRFLENRISLAYASRVGGRLSLGVSGKLVDRSTTLDAVDIRSGNGLGVDFGVHAGPLPRLRVGLLLQDAFNTAIRYDQGGTAISYSRNLRGGLAYDVGRLGTVAFDLDDRWHVGAEARPFESLALRAGAERDLNGDEGLTWSTGLGARVGILRFDWALVSPPVLPTTSHFGVSFAFNFNPSLVRVDRVTLRPIYSSLSSYYASEEGKIGDVVLSNKGGEELPAVLSVMIPGYMSKPLERNIVVPPSGSATLFPLRAVLSDAAMKLREDQRVPVEVQVRYASLRVNRHDKLDSETTLHRPGSIDWSAGLDQAAAFVTPRDPAVETVGRAAGVTAGRSFDSDIFPSEGLCSIAAAVEAMGAVGVTYVRDPLNPYDVVHNSAHPIDTIYYPRHTLAAHAGDCDDSSVLTASVLANIGIRTRFVDAPEHIFVLADCEIPASDLAGLPLKPELFVPIDGTLWIPIETTLLSNGFVAAWSRGAEVWSQLDAGRRDSTVDVALAIQKYAAVEPTETPEPPRFDADSISTRIHRTRDLIAAWEESRVDSLRAAMRDGSRTPDGLNAAAGVCFRAGKFEAAEELLELGLKSAPDSPGLLANRAAVAVRQGRFQEAAVTYQRLAEEQRGNPEPCVNLSLLYQALGDSAMARHWMGIARIRAGGAERVESLLHLVSPRVGSRSMPGRDARQALRELISASGGTPSGADTTSALQPITGRGSDDAASSAIVSRLIWASTP